MIITHIERVNIYVFSSSVGLVVYRREEGEETVNTMQT